MTIGTVTCMSFYNTEEWQWLYKEWGYTGDYGFIFLNKKKLF